MGLGDLHGLFRVSLGIEDTFREFKYETMQKRFCLMVQSATSGTGQREKEVQVESLKIKEQQRN